MAGSFPTEFPAQGLQAITKAMFGGGNFDGQVVLGAYDIIGFGLYQAFGDVRYMMSEMGDDVHNLMAQAPPEVMKAAEFFQNNPDVMKGDLPPWLIPMAQQLAQYVIQKLFERFSQQQNPTFFGRQIMMQSALPKETGGAFPERSQGVPTGTGLFTQSRPAQSVPQAQPSDKIQQPTGDKPEAHPSLPQSSKSPQFQGNTADPEKPHDPKPVFNDTQSAGAPASQPGGPAGPVTNNPGQPLTPGTSARPTPAPVANPTKSN